MSGRPADIDSIFHRDTPEEMALQMLRAACRSKSVRAKVLEVIRKRYLTSSNLLVEKERTLSRGR